MVSEAHLQNNALSQRPRSLFAVGGWLECLLLVLLIAGTLLVVMAAAAWMADCPIGQYWERNFWLDEFYTYLMVQGHPDQTMLQALSKGGDYNPPFLYVCLQGWTTLFGTTEAAFRSFTSACVLLSLVTVYYLIGIWHSRLVSFTTAVGLWCGNGILLINQSFEARFYGLWLLEVALLALVLMRPVQRHKYIRYILIAALSVMIAMTHYFGIISLALLGVAHIFSAVRNRQRWIDTMCMAPGALALIVMLPVFQAQQALFEGRPSTWIQEPTFDSTLGFIKDTYQIWFIFIPVFGYLLQRVLGKKPIGRLKGSLKPYATLLALGLFPVLLVLLSWTVQPVLYPRYGIPFLLFGVPLVAWLLSGCEQKRQIGVLLIYCLLGTLVAFSYLIQHRFRVQNTAAEYIEDVLPTPTMPIYTTSRLVAYPLWHYGMLTNEQVGIFFIPAGGDERYMLVEATNHLNLLSLGQKLPHLMTPKMLQEKEQFYFLLDPRELKRLRYFLPGYDSELLDDPNQEDSLVVYLFRKNSVNEGSP